MSRSRLFILGLVRWPLGLSGHAGVQESATRASATTMATTDVLVAARDIQNWHQGRRGGREVCQVPIR